MSAISDDMKKHNGSFTRTASSTHCCSLWHIPGMCDYHLAKSVVVFFDNKDDAENFCRPNSMPPEMCEVYDFSNKIWDDHFSMGKYGEYGIFTHENHC
ncbi:hypothetical protein JA33_251 [Dickeya phage vB_DsoM_JA33]|uniref:Uncharacterized protein n=3 Tax=Salmondvirus JA11 TaxID=2734141 RepID=A0A384ZWP7_9CAUD|nr:hypothetical protein HOU32_gp250 [Dickeya phage vB_DsoM_JA11]AXG66654.1 hypothetical protein JA13_251 [Dickeya phage vB_DsoM_JA13]AXG67625.1 hypothetical protein JA33_251 [Dickeya phage vB_DsoM_JA33]AYD80055.1 hypothetical protein JA11_250 [Dickeya phage vB_DsoM_JA11]